MSTGNRSFNSAWSGLGRELLDGAQGVASKQIDAAFVNGFDEAATICINLITGTTADLLAKITDGELLSPTEQQILARMIALKADMESQLRGYEIAHNNQA